MAKQSGLTVIVSPRAQRELRSLTRRNSPLAKASDDCFRALSSDPRPRGVEKVAVQAKLKHDPRTGAALKRTRRVDLRRVRVDGNYRAVYAIVENMVLVVIVKVGDRKEVYGDIAEVGI